MYIFSYLFVYFCYPSSDDELNEILKTGAKELKYDNCKLKKKKKKKSKTKVGKRGKVRKI